MKTFTFTMEQIKAIYSAGCRRGEDEASAYDWGSSASGGKYDNMIEAIYDIINDGKSIMDDDRVGYDVVEKMVMEING